MPVILPVKEIPSQLNAPPVADANILLLELFEVCSKLNVTASIDEFLGWGEQLLKDFNELDRQLADVHSVFKRSFDLQKLDFVFSADEEDIERLNAFWKEFSSDDLTPLRKGFLKYWEQMPDVYDAYKLHLIQKGFVYDGLAWRIASGAEISFTEKFDHIVFCGFYALTNAEEKILGKIHKTGKLKLYRDYDTWYGASYREAGRYFRKGLLGDPSLNFTGSYFEKDSKEINITGVNGKNAMAREMAAAIAKSHPDKDPAVLARSVAVLPDESLLFPFLDYCLRAGITVNPSMGYPLTHHPFLHFLSVIRIIRRERVQRSDGGWMKNKAEYLSGQSFVQGFTQSQIKSGLDELSNGDAVTKPDAFTELITNTVKDAGQEEKLFLGLINLLPGALKESVPGLYMLMKDEFHKIINSLRPYYHFLSADNWWKLFLQSAASIRIPFRSERNNGIPVTGFLETRNLDFEQVFIASMNEGILPSSKVLISLIPYPVRKAFGLPCNEEADAVTSYHFYRLLQRAKNISLFYNSDLNDLGGGERSRYIYQLDHELKTVNPNIKFNYFQVEQNVPVSTPEVITIPKSNYITGALIKKYHADHSEADRGLSVSALATYISCPLRFYLENIAGIRPEEEHNTIDPLVFGNILHRTMHLLYGENSQPDRNFLESLINKVPDTVRKAISEIFTPLPLTGNDLLMEGVICSLVTSVIKQDIENIPFSLVALENTIHTTIDVPVAGKIRLKGIIDRIDQRNGILSLLDYKTGKDVIKDPVDYADLFKDPKYKTTLQLYFYAVIYRRSAGYSGPVKAGMLSLRNVKEGIEYINKGQVIDMQHLDVIEEKLAEAISELFDPGIPFTQTEDVDRCKFCSYSGLCARNS